MYGQTTTEAIIDHPKHGRLYLIQGYGGEGTIAGAAPRWRHGAVCRVLGTDTLESLRGDANEYTSVINVALAGHDPDRPLLDWTGHMIKRCALAVIL